MYVNSQLPSDREAFRKPDDFIDPARRGECGREAESAERMQIDAPVDGELKHFLRATCRATVTQIHCFIVGVVL